VSPLRELLGLIEKLSHVSTSSSCGHEYDPRRGRIRVPYVQWRRMNSSTDAAVLRRPSDRSSGLRARPHAKPALAYSSAGQPTTSSGISARLIRLSLRSVTQGAKDLDASRTPGCVPSTAADGIDVSDARVGGLAGGIPHHRDRTGQFDGHCLAQIRDIGSVRTSRRGRRPAATSRASRLCAQ
jgi:hypothetical protein